MCRIAGIISSKFSPSALNEHILAMMELQRHGGPDGEGKFIDSEQHLALGHRRLSLLDLSEAGSQPFRSADGKYHIVFNGEVYNFIALREQLQKEGFVFNSRTDTEVILNAYIKWGIQSFGMLRGMFAFAIYDTENSELILARDSQGIKPLYYYQENGDLLFASEVKAFKQIPVKLSTHPDWPVYFLSFGHLPEPITTYSEVKMLPKGHFLRFSVRDKKVISQASFAKATSPSLAIKDYAVAQQLVNDTLDKAIQRQLIADAPIGVFLSGGIDSSLLALQAAKYQQEKLITISLHFPEARFSEKPYQQIVSQRLPGAHISKEVTHKDFEQYFEQIIANMDQPSVDGINSWFVSKAAKESGIKAVLSGIGADELFGGYPSFRRMRYIPVAGKLKSLVAVLSRFRQQDALERFSFLRKNSNPAYEYLFLRGFFPPRQLEEMFAIDTQRLLNSLDQLAPPAYDLPESYDGKRASWYEQHYFMQNQLLKDADAMSMQHGLEIRVPFLDEDVVAAAQAIDAKVLFDRSRPAKHLLINSFDKLLPEAVWNRPKMGFTFPFQQWIKKHPEYQDLKNKDHSIVKKDFFHQFEKDQIHWSKVMSLLVLEKFNGH